MTCRILPQYAQYPDAGFQSLLPKLIPELANIAKTKAQNDKVEVPANAGLSVISDERSPTEPLVQDDFVSL